MRTLEHEKKVKISAQILEILQENKCSLAEAHLIFRTVNEKYRISAQLHCDDFLEELTADYQKNLLP